MFSIWIFLFLLGTPILNFPCQLLLNSNAKYDLTQLQQVLDYSLQYTWNGKDMILYYNFCKLTSHQCKGQNSFATIFEVADPNNCVALTEDSASSNFSYNLLQTNSPQYGLLLEFQNNIVQFEMNIFCDINGKTLLFQNFLVDGNYYVANISTQYACPTLAGSVLLYCFNYSVFMQNHFIFFGIIMIVVGVVMALFGFKLLLPTMFIGTLFVTLLFSLQIFTNFVFSDNQDFQQQWSACVFSIIISCFMGYLATLVPRLGFFFLGVNLGVVFAFLLHNAILYMIVTEPPQLFLIGEMLLFGLVLGVLSCCLWRKIVILSSSFLGSYLLFRGISLMVGGYPSEFDINIMIQFHQISKVPYVYYVYFAVIIGNTIKLAFGGGANFFQNKQRKLREKTKKKERKGTGSNVTVVDDEIETQNMDNIGRRKSKDMKKNTVGKQFKNDLESGLIELEMSSIQDKYIVPEQPKKYIEPTSYNKNKPISQQTNIRENQAQISNFKDNSLIKQNSITQSKIINNNLSNQKQAAKKIDISIDSDEKENKQQNSEDDDADDLRLQQLMNKLRKKEDFK